MNSIICQIKANQKTPAKAIAITKSLMDEWGCSNGQSIKLELGNKSMLTRIVRAKLPGKQIFLPTTLSKQIALPFSGSTRAAFFNKRLRLGPVIGILTTGYTGNAETPFGARSALFKSFITAGLSEKPFIYVFTPEMVDWHNQTISGWYLRKDGTGRIRWVRHTSPFPDVIYERVPNRKVESLPQVQECLNRLKETNHCQIFNQGFFNKWAIHQWLSKDAITSEFVPETYVSPSLATLQEMLDRHQMVYLKPSGGSLGFGIFRITRHHKDGYYCRFSAGDRNVLHRFRSLDRLVQAYFGNQREKFKKYLVQQGIRLIKYNGRPVDFRVHMHKDHTGEWKVVAIGSKAAGFGCVTTHVRTGGSIIPTEDLLDAAFESSSTEVKDTINQSAVAIAKVLEQHVDGPLGELGMDMGVDQHGYVWLFEINSKPGRHIFHHPSLRAAGQQSAKYITDYSMKLARFV